MKNLFSLGAIGIGAVVLWIVSAILSVAIPVAIIVVTLRVLGVL